MQNEDVYFKYEYTKRKKEKKMNTNYIMRYIIFSIGYWRYVIKAKTNN